MAKKRNNRQHTHDSKVTEPERKEQPDPKGRPAQEEGARGESTGTLDSGSDLLGDFAGITMGEGTSSSKKKEAFAPDEEIELAVEEDRARLWVTGALFLLLAFAGLLLIGGGIGATQLTQNVLCLIFTIVGFPLTWFASKAMGRRLRRAVLHVHAIDFGKQHVYVYNGSDTNDVIVVKYRDIKNYKLIRQGSALRLLLAGTWVKHPSGFELIDINRPFMAGTLDGLEKDITEVMRRHRVNERK